MKKIAFEGGQTTLWKRTPKYGNFRKNMGQEFNFVNLDKIRIWIARGRIDPTKTITMQVLRDSGILGGGAVCPKNGIKLLAKNVQLFTNTPLPLQIEVTDASVAAQRAVEVAGGKVKLVWFNRLGLRAHFKPEKFPHGVANNGIPPQKKRIKYREYMEEYLAKNPQFADRLWMPPPKELTLKKWPFVDTLNRKDKRYNQYMGLDASFKITKNPVDREPILKDIAQKHQK